MIYLLTFDHPEIWHFQIQDLPNSTRPYPVDDQ